MAKQKALTKTAKEQFPSLSEQLKNNLVKARSCALEREIRL